MDIPTTAHDDLPRLLKNALMAALPGADINIASIRRDDRPFFMITVRASQFCAVPRLDQHRLVYRALTGLVDYDQPIFSLRTAEIPV
jgi:stress-induced morphogen